MNDGDELPAAPTIRTIGSIYGKAITASNVDLTGRIDPAWNFDARDKARWELKGRTVVALDALIVHRFVERQEVKVLVEEIAQFMSNMGDRFEGEKFEEEPRMCILPWRIERE